jgi:pimeloyl-ACP methyl ester carboxylesterase
MADAGRMTRLLLALCLMLALSGCISGIKYGAVPHAQLAADTGCDPAPGNGSIFANKPVFAVTSRLPDCRTTPLQLTNFRADELRYLRFGAPPKIIDKKTKSANIVFAFQSEADWWAQLATAAKPSNGRIILYIHGFKETFDSNSRDSLQIQRLNGGNAPIIQYSWPSQGRLLGYGIDETNMYFDEFNFRVFLQNLAQQPWAKDIVIVAHSLGTRLVIPAIEYVDRNSSNADANNISNIILVSPDLDRQAFERDVGEGILTPRRVNAGRRMTLYVSAKDKALGVSRTLHGYPRLGEPFCFNPFERADLKARGLPERCYPANFKNADTIGKALTIIDTSEVSIGQSGHSNHLRSAVACLDFAAVLKVKAGTERQKTYLPYVFTLKPVDKDRKVDDEAMCQTM